MVQFLWNCSAMSGLRNDFVEPMWIRRFRGGFELYREVPCYQEICSSTFLPLNLVFSKTFLVILSGEFHWDFCFLHHSQS